MNSSRANSSSEHTARYSDCTEHTIIQHALVLPGMLPADPFNLGSLGTVVVGAED
jgi:hypothetical protein